MITVLRKPSCPTIQETLWQSHTDQLSWDQGPFTLGSSVTQQVPRLAPYTAHTQTVGQGFP